jgi:mannose-1-phosphate guanylyltransferase
MPNLHAVIMAGGSGTRFWPASRQARPKQLLPLANGQTLIAATVERVRGLVGIERVWVVTNASQSQSIAAAVPSLSPEHILVEPEPRDTAPCVALATATIGAADPDAILAVLPADQLISPTDAFERLLTRGASIATDHKTLVTFGIAPTRPATGYGYIELGDRWDQVEPAAFRVALFREKPDLETARHFVSTGRFLWNSGIFVWSPAALLEAMEASAPDLASALRAMVACAQRGDTAGLLRTFSSARKVSIDYAVMEKAPRVAVVRSEIAWDDVGSFLTLGSVAGQDENGNVAFCHGGASVIAHETSDTTAYAEGPRTIALFGVTDLVVVAVGDAVLVCPKQKAEGLKSLIARIRELGRGDLL